MTTTTTTDKPSFVYVIYITTTAEKLWEALTRGDFTEKYWGGRRVESEWRVGAPIHYRYDEGRKLDITGEVLRCEPPKVLAYTFGVGHDAGGPREAPSRVTFEIRPMGPLCRLTLTHDEFPPGSKLLPGIANGWPGIMSNLKSWIELGQPMPFPNWCADAAE